MVTESRLKGHELGNLPTDIHSFLMSWLTLHICPAKRKGQPLQDSTFIVIGFLFIVFTIPFLYFRGIELFRFFDGKIK